MREMQSPRNLRQHWFATAVVVLLATVPVVGFGQTPFLIKDINTGSEGSNDGFPWRVLAECGGYLYFNGETKSTGEELWRTDGTEAGTQLVVEGWPSENDGLKPRYFACAGDTLFFAGIELWKSDGTALGTMMVKDINTEPNGYSYPKSLTAIGDLVFFQATDGIHGEEPWVSDGTEAGTIMLRDIRSGSVGSLGGITSFFEFGGDVFFPADQSGYGMWLWKTDGTPSGTELVKQISYPNEFTDGDGFFFLGADDGINGFELWKSDGTEAGTVMIKDINPNGSSLAGGFGAIGGTLYFEANDGVNGSGLWKSDGTEAGTVLVKVINPSGWPDIQDFQTVGSTVYFSANDDPSGYELWKSDGTEAGTVMVADVNPSGSSYPYNFETLGNVLFFSADDGTHGIELWKSDGTDTGTVMVKDIGAFSSSSPSCLTAWAGALFFSANDGTTGVELWRSDGTAAGTFLVKNIFSEERDSNPAAMNEFGGRLFFWPTTKSMGAELWTTDGSTAGTVLFKSIYSGPPSAGPGAFHDLGTAFLLTAESFSEGYELWKSDGTSPGTVLLKDIWPGRYSSSPYYFTQLTGGTVVFRANDGTNGAELWKTDGTEIGTLLVKDIYPGSTSSNIQNMESLGSTAVFRANDGIHGYELWVSDGTNAGTQLLKEINPGAASSSPAYFHSVGGKVFFKATETANGSELWLTDGTTPGTILVKDIFPGSDGSSPYLFADLDGLLYFRADDGIHGTELWRSDGTEIGTFMVKDIWSGSDGGVPSLVGIIDGTMVLSAVDADHGRELWVSDGTNEGTRFLYDIIPGSDSWSPWGIETHDGFTYFTAYSPETGVELWRTDGTPDGTSFLADVRPGPEGSHPDMNQHRIFNDEMIFVATDNEVGKELWGLCVGAFYEDLDSDGHGDPDSVVFDCSQPSGYIPNGDDCDDGDDSIYEGATELCDLKDNDCDGRADEPSFGGLISAGPAAGSDCAVDLAWSAAGPAPCGGTSTYSVYRSTSPGFTPSASNRIAENLTSTTFTDTFALGSGITYYYVVRVTAMDNDSEDVNLVRLPVTLIGCTATAPSRPPFLTARATNTRVDLEWLNPEWPYSMTRICWSDSGYVMDPDSCSPDVDDISGAPGAGDSMILSAGISNDIEYYFSAFVEGPGTGLWSNAAGCSSRPSADPTDIPWVFSTGASSLAPTGVRPGEVLFTVSNDRSIHSVSAGSGGGIWPVGWKPVAMNGPAQARPAPVPFASTTIDGASEVVFISSEDGHVYAVDSVTGRELWRSSMLGDMVIAAPSGVLTDYGGAFDVILVGSRTVSGDSKFYGLNLQTGAIEWVFDNGGGSSGIGVISGQAQVDYGSNRVYFASRRKTGGSANTVWCLELVDPPTNFELKWARDIGNVDSSPILRGGVLYVGNNSGEVFALDPADGSDEWAAPYIPGSSVGPVKGFVWVDTTMTPTQLYYSTTAMVHAVVDNGNSAAQLWPPIPLLSPSPIIVVGDDLWVGSAADNGSIRRINKNTGTQTASTLLGDPAVAKTVGAPTFDIETSLITVGTDEGRVYAVEVP